MPSKRVIWITAALFFLAVILRIVPGPRTIDDAFITFRYARNLLAGDGFVFNPGERVLGTTTPLFTILLSGVGILFGGASAPFPSLAVSINTLADGISCILLFLIGNKLGSRWAGFGAGLAWAVAPFSVTFAIGGLETSVYVLLLIAIFWSYLERRYEISAFLSALALLTRPDALLLVLPLVIDRLLFATRRGSPYPSWREALLFVIPGLIWGTFAWSYFGSPFPQSVLAKSAAYRLPQFAALIRFLQHYATPFVEHFTFGLAWIGVGLILYPFLSLLGAGFAFKQKTSTWPFSVFPWLYFAVFALANPLVFRWYLTPPLPFYFMFVLIGLERILQQLISWSQSKVRIPRAAQQTSIVALLVLFPSLLPLNGWTRAPTHGPSGPAPDMAWIELELLYKEVADELHPRLAPETTLAAGDVGVLGYYTDVQILDLVGLNSPETSRYFPLPPEQYGDFVYAVPAELILDQLPEYVVLLEIYGRYSLLQNDDFLRSYALVARLDTQLYESDGLLVYKLK
ncbi:MAG: hypothetical protein ACRDFQ_07765 [Anaerolineales bacterium]